jgi:hypothetical protein
MDRRWSGSGLRECRSQSCATLEARCARNACGALLVVFVRSAAVVELALDALLRRVAGGLALGAETLER